MTYTIKFTKGDAPFPDYRQIPVLLWGNNVDFDSEGDCLYPADRNWTELYIAKRPQMKERVHIYKDDNEYVIESDNRLLANSVAVFLVEWTGGSLSNEDQNKFLSIRAELIAEFEFIDKWELAETCIWKYATKDNPYPNLNPPNEAMHQGQSH